LRPLPTRLVRRLSDRDRAAAASWWAGLAAADRFAVAASCRPLRRRIGGHRVVGGRFVPRDDAAGWAEWEASRFDDLLCLPDRVFYEPPFVRTFHIG
jgi:hypothetical protein